MPYMPFLLSIGLIAAAWPSALPFALAYYLIGAAVGAFFVAASRRHRDINCPLSETEIMAYWLYVWPLCAFLMFASAFVVKK